MAQSGARLSAGVGVKFFESTGKVGPTPLIRGRRSGFGPTLGLNWHNTEVGLESRGLSARGDLRVRPVMVGPSYTVIRGRVAATLGAMGGYSFNRISSSMPGRGEPVEFRVKNSLAWAPTAILGLDLTRKAGLLAQASYLVTRPQVTTLSAGIEHRSRFRADTLVVQGGVVFKLF